MASAARGLARASDQIPLRNLISPRGCGLCVVNQQKWDTLRPEKVIAMRSVERAP